MFGENKENKFIALLRRWQPFLISIAYVLVVVVIILTLSKLLLR